MWWFESSEVKTHGHPQLRYRWNWLLWGQHGSEKNMEPLGCRILRYPTKSLSIEVSLSIADTGITESGVLKQAQPCSRTTTRRHFLFPMEILFFLPESQLGFGCSTAA